MFEIMADIGFFPLDWAGGPGVNPEDVRWLDQKMAAFFEENI